ncbi:MAG: thioredoxin family protein [Haloarculaceae archaeon]
MTEQSPDAVAQVPDRPQDLENAADLESFRESHDFALVEFYTDGCGVCASMEPVLSGIAREPDLAVGLINPRNDPPLVEAFDVRGVPLLALFQDGEVVARRADGFVGVDELRAWLDGYRR